MKQGTFTIVLLTLALAVGIAIYIWFGAQPKGTIFHAIFEGGPLVSVLIAFIIMIFAYVIERTIALNKAKGKGSMADFIREVKEEIEAGRIDGAIAKCDAHQSSLAAVIRAGLDKYKSLVARKVTDPEKRRTEMQKAIEDATAVEMPLLRKEPCCPLYNCLNFHDGRTAWHDDWHDSCLYGTCHRRRARCGPAFAWYFRSALQHSWRHFWRHCCDCSI